MNVLLFGATGMVGQGVLRECLLAPDVGLVTTIGRRATGQHDPKLREIVLPDMFDYRGLEHQLSGYDACFFCLGVSSFRMEEADYTRLTYDLTLAAAEALAPLNPQMTFVYVSGAHTDGSEQGRTMWARVKGRTENALLKLPFRRAFMFRPGAIQPLRGVKSATRSYRILYNILKPVLGAARRIAPSSIATTESIGLAMLSVARHGAPKPVLETADIEAAAKRA